MEQKLENLSIDLSQNLNDFSICFNDEEISNENIDDKVPILSSKNFNIELRGAKFTFECENDFFTLKQLCELILKAWNSILTKQQWDEMSLIMDMWEYEPTTCNLICQPTILNGLDLNINGFYYPIEMQD
ncbi:Hypothetical protein KVN_LOCUS305 [uncultured virus]|nr:Hypothetical protein KVN_LOCUS305 [uncultured virus]